MVVWWESTYLTACQSILLNYSEFLIKNWTIDWHEHGSYLYYSRTDLDLEIYGIYESNHEATWKGCAKAMQKSYAESDLYLEMTPDHVKSRIK